MSNKDHEEMKRYIQAWMTSKKYADIRKELDKRKEDLLSLKSLNKEEILKQMGPHYLTKAELIQMINDILEFDSLSDEDKSELIWVTDLSSYKKSKDDLYTFYIRGLVTWYIYIYIYQKTEDYKLCEKIQNVIALDRKEMIANLNDFFDFDPTDEVRMAEIEQHIIEEILLK